MEKNRDKEQDLQESKGAAVNVVSSFVLMIICVAVIVRSFQMPRPEGWASAPGIIPLFVAVCLFFMSVQLLRLGLKHGGMGQVKSFLKSKNKLALEPEAKAGLKRSLWIVLLVAGYVFILLGRIRFEIATFIYLVVTLTVFWRRGGWVRILILSTVLPFFVTFMFRYIFNTLVPGESIVGWIIQ